MPSAALPAPLVLAFVLLFAVRDARASPSFCDEQPGWKLDWKEEFDGVALNASSWSALDLQTYDIGCCRDAACLPDNVLVAGGALHLSSERRHVEGYNFTTGAIRTKGKRSWTATAASAFRVCVSAILPGGGHGADGAAQGIWPAHWMMPDSEGCWPDLGEMDILEMINGDGRAHATYHWDANYPAKNCTQPDGHKLHGSYMNMTTWDTQFHEYALERGTEHVAFVYDGLLLLNVSLAAFPDAKMWQVPWYIILNTAVGGDWAGPVGPNTIFPTRHIVDYVKVAVSL